MAGLAALAAFTGGAAQTALAVGGLVLSAAGTISQARAAKQAGLDQQAALNYQSQQQEAAADAERAAGQRRARERRRQGEIIASNQRAAAAAQGGGGDQSVINLMGDSDREAEIGAEMELYEAEQRARGYTTAAELSRHSGRQARDAGRRRAIGIGIGGVSSMYDRFGSQFAQSQNTSGYRYG